MPGFTYVFLIGSIVGLAARLVYPGRNTVHGFALTTLLGTVGAAVATHIARVTRLVEMDHLASFISMFVAALVVLFIWNQLAIFGIVPDPGRLENDI